MELGLKSGLKTQKLCSLPGLQGTRQHNEGQIRSRGRHAGPSPQHCSFKLKAAA